MFNTSRPLLRPMLALAGFILILAACGGGESTARDAAVGRSVADGMGQEVAECIVDGVADAFGDEALAEDYEGAPDQLGQTFEITDVCLFGE